jgi:hypothetical protein
MKMLKIGTAIGALAFSALVNAQAYFVCGSVACPSTRNAFNDPTGINDLNIRGDIFDVTFTTTAPASSPFVFSNTVAAPGQPLTGIDAGDAISAFYAGVTPGDGQGPGQDGSSFITAFAPAGDLSVSFRRRCVNEFA